MSPESACLPADALRQPVALLPVSFSLKALVGSDAKVHRVSRDLCVPFHTCQRSNRGAFILQVFVLLLHLSNSSSWRCSHGSVTQVSLSLLSVSEVRVGLWP